MAFLPKDEKDKEDELLEGSGDDNPSLQSGGGVLAPGGSGDGEAGTKPGDGGGAPTNVRTYADRNRPATQRLADKVGQSVRDRGEAARNTLGQQSEAFNQAVGNAETRDDVGLRNQALSDPTAITKDAGQTARFKSLRDAEYKGPKTLEETDFYQPVSQAYGEANQARERLGTTGGRQELIAGVSRPGQRISKGRLTLDEALLSSDPNARGTLKGAGDSLNDLEQRLADASAAARARAQQGVDTTNATRQATRDTLGQARTAFEADLDARLATARQTATDRTNAARQAMGGGFTYGLKDGQLVDTSGIKGADINLGELSDERLAQIGMTRDELTNRLQRGGSGPGQAFRDAGIDQFLVRPPSVNVTDQAVSDLGLSREQFDRLFGPELDSLLDQYRSKGLNETQKASLPAEFFRALGDTGRYVRALSPEAEITRGNLATVSDYDRLDALNTLSDEQNMFLNPAERAKAGTANLDLVDLDRGAFIGAAEQALEDAVRESYRLRNNNARSGGDTFIKKSGASLATGGLMPSGSSFKDIGKGLFVPGSDQMMHLIDPRTPMMLPGGVGGVGDLNTPGTDFGPYNKFTEDMAAEPELRQPTEEELNQLRSLI